MNNLYKIIMNKFYNLYNKVNMAIEELLCISYPNVFIIQLNKDDIYYLFDILTSNNKKENDIIQKGIYLLNIICLQTEKELFDFSLSYLEKIEKEIKENKITEQKYIVLSNYLKKMIELKTKMIKNSFVYYEDELIIYKENNNYIYEFYF